MTIFNPGLIETEGGGGGDRGGGGKGRGGQLVLIIDKFRSLPHNTTADYYNTKIGRNYKSLLNENRRKLLEFTLRK